MTLCWSCHQNVETNNFGRADTCAKCGRDTRVCLNCKNYDAAAYNACHEPQADRVVDKERSNFCDYFSPGAGKSSAEKDAQARAKAAAEALFSFNKKK